MKQVGVAILGLGVVGGGTYEILTKNHDYFMETQKLDIKVKEILEKNPARLKQLNIGEEIAADSIEEVVSDPDVDIVVECIGGIELARSFVLQALKSGKSVVTSNKELVAKYWHELEAEAKNKNAGLYFEASCVGGVPIIRTLQEGLMSNKICSIKGIINGTTNYILTKMSEEGMGYEEALKQAQSLGYAEFNPTADVDGFDAQYKLSILSSLAFEEKVPIANIHREGITKITKEDIVCANKLGYVVKLLGIGKKSDKGVEVRVNPTFVPKSNPLASVKDSFNAVHIVGDSVGEIMLYGRGAGALPTGSAIVSDVIFAAKYKEIYYSPFKNTLEGDKSTKFVTDFVSKYFVRLTVKDQTGVLSKISGLFAKHEIGINEVKQESAVNGNATVMIITHETKESHFIKAISKIKDIQEVVSVDSYIRVEE